MWLSCTKKRGPQLRWASKVAIARSKAEDLHLVDANAALPGDLHIKGGPISSGVDDEMSSSLAIELAKSMSNKTIACLEANRSDHGGRL